MKHLFCFILLIALEGCASASPIEGNSGPITSDESSEILPYDFNAGAARCYSRWGVLIAEWHAHGGGIGASIMETREQIASDTQSRFAAIVRNAWEAQSISDARSRNEIGEWPIGVEEHRRVTSSIRFRRSDELGPDCETTDWLLSYLWSEVTRNSSDPSKARRLREVPDMMDWESPFAQQWIDYWLFVRLKP